MINPIKKIIFIELGCDKSEFGSDKSEFGSDEKIIFHFQTLDIEIGFFGIYQYHYYR